MGFTASGQTLSLTSNGEFDPKRPVSKLIPTTALQRYRVFASARFRVAQFHVFGVHTLVWSDTAELAGLPERTGLQVKRNPPVGADRIGAWS